MKRDTLQKKRRPVQKRKGLTFLYSKTRKKKQRVSASAAADLGSEVPNLGVARALFIILLLHVVAIGCIIVRNNMNKDEIVAPATEPAAKVNATTMAASNAPASLPQVQQGEDYYFVATGDSYERVAQLKGVNVQDLRALNDNVPMKAGRILRIPTAGVSTMADAPVDYDTSNPLENPGRKRMAASEAMTVSNFEPVEENLPEPVRAVIVEEVAPPAVVAVHVRPLIDRSAVTAVPSGQKYIVKSGDTVWSISRRFEVSRENLLQVNGVSDPRKLKIGMTLVIPAN
jgi:LysM repeat protein